MVETIERDSNSVVLDWRAVREYHMKRSHETSRHQGR